MDLSPIFKQQFADYVVELAEQKGGILKEYITQVEETDSAKFTFSTLGTVVTKAPSAAGVRDVGQEIATSTVDCIVEDAEVVVYEKKLDQAKAVSKGAAGRVANRCVNALGRKEDQQIINAMEAAVTAGKVTNVVPANFDDGATDSAFSLKKWIKAAELLNSSGDGSGMRVLLGTPKTLTAMLNSTEITSRDFNTVQALVEGRVDSYMGMKFIMLADTDDLDPENKRGLPGVGTADRKLYAMDADALGFVDNVNKSARIEWDVSSSSFKITGDMSSNACVIDPSLVVEISVKEA